jgi:microcystin-dependent protein
MSQPYVGEIRMFGASFAPAGWMFCNGALLPISENDTLFNLIGTTYGGDGQETFGLPDLQGRTPVHAGTAKSGITYTLGEAAGVESVTLNTNQIPIHNHPYVASSAIGAGSDPTNSLISQHPTASAYAVPVPTTPMNAGVVGPSGGSQPHDNMQPYLCVTYIISLFGIYPPPS